VSARLIHLAKFFLGLGLLLPTGWLVGAPKESSDPAANITEVEERLLKMAPYFNEFAKDLSTRGIEAAAARTYPSAPLLEPADLGPASSDTPVKGWDSTLSRWTGLETSPARPYEPGKSRPLGWLDRLIPATGAVQIKTFDGELVPQGETFLFRTHHKFIINAKAGAPLANATITLDLDWGSDGKQLLIIRWKVFAVDLIRSVRTQPLLATDALEAAIPSAQTLADLRECRHDTYLRAMFKNPTDLRKIELEGFPAKYLQHLTAESGEQHPGVSVVDINRDGFDDIYLMRRWGPNRLLVNQRDGTFKEEAAKYGLAIEDVCTCAIFADFDNDGDADVFIGRTLERSVLMENKDGRFEDTSHQVHGTRLPYLVSSAAAADYDGDGLIDLYLGTYFGHTQGRKEGWEREFLEPEDREEYLRRSKVNTDLFYDFVAPPNMLLRNKGAGRFELAPENEETKLWRATLQPTFADWDNDGDQDLLVTNDFGPDVMLRNDPGQGRRHFVNVTTELAPYVHTNYFGMGGSWGDYDNDGNLDLYLSAMFSKAGTRITGRLKGYDVRARQSALGNLLLRGTGDGHLVKTSGQEPGQHPVDQVGWAWGGQFFDPDNDGHLDLYCPTGYFTPPKEYSTEVDY
jgi:hypothetical protein